MKFVVTAGPTREYLDPVRFLSNPSTGKMGFAVARAAAMRGHEVALVAGPVSLKTPKGVRRIDVTSARDMLAAVERELSQQAPRITHQRRSRAGTRHCLRLYSGGCRLAASEVCSEEAQEGADVRHSKARPQP